MNWFKKAKYLEINDLLGDNKSPQRRQVSKDAPAVESFTLTLYRGFDADLEGLERSGDQYILDPKRCEQGVLWFTHNYISGYNPVDYVKGRGEYILEYPLECKKHYQKIHFDDGTESTITPLEILDASNPYENSKIHMGIELPDGFLFSYKTEKFIICEKQIFVTKQMIKKDSDYELV